MLARSSWLNPLLVFAGCRCESNLPLPRELKSESGAHTRITPGPIRPTAARPSHVRYYVVLLTFLAALLTYADRVCIGAATPAIMKDFGLSKIAMGWSVSAFNWSYALFQIPAGWLADRFGARLVLGGAMAWWSIFTAATGLTSGAASLAATRGLFGAGESAAFPASSRALLKWLPFRQRATGQGIQHAGSRFGAAITPPFVVFLMARMHWPLVFDVFAGAGIIVAAAWYLYYRDLPAAHPGVNSGELDIIGAGDPRPALAVRRPVPWNRIFRSRDLMYLSLAYFCYGWVLWVYLQWVPTYLMEARGFSQSAMGVAASLPLFAATVANVIGGWVSDRVARRTGNLRKARVTVSIAGYSFAAVCLAAGMLASSAATCLAWLTAALGGTEFTVAISWAICLDIGSEFSGSVSSVMSMMGNIGGAMSAVAGGYLATYYGWDSPFLVSGALCVLAALAISRVQPTRSAVG